jgi:hypothetical protein
VKILLLAITGWIVASVPLTFLIARIFRPHRGNVSTGQVKKKSQSQREPQASGIRIA